MNVFFVLDDITNNSHGYMEQAKPETVDKVVGIVRKQLALADDKEVNGESQFSKLGADSLDTVKSFLL